jgi:hypothetical protein
MQFIGMWLQSDGTASLYPAAGSGERDDKPCAPQRASIFLKNCTITSVYRTLFLAMRRTAVIMYYIGK